MQIDVTTPRPDRDKEGKSDALISLRLEALRWNREFALPGCSDPTLAWAAARAYAWYLGYLLYSNAALVQANAARSVVEHTRDGGRTFVEVGLHDGAGACIEMVTVGVALADRENRNTEVGEVLRKQGLTNLHEFADAPAQAIALFGDWPFYTLPLWMDRALQAARRLEISSLPQTSGLGAELVDPRTVTQAPSLRAS